MSAVPVGGRTPSRGQHSNRLRFVPVLLLSALLALLAAGCTDAGVNGEDRMLQYLQSKYSETFQVEDVSGDSFLPPEFSATDVLVVHPESDSTQLFVVAEDQDAPGELKDERVLAAWGDWYERNYIQDIRNAFGADASLRVQAGSPESWQFGMTELGLEPTTLFEDANRRSSLQFLVAVPVSGEPDVARYAEDILSTWKLVQTANSGDGYPELSVYFYDATANPTRYLDLRSIPGAAVNWRSMPGVKGIVAIAAGSNISTMADIVAAYRQRVGE